MVGGENNMFAINKQCWVWACTDDNRIRVDCLPDRVERDSVIVYAKSYCGIENSVGYIVV